MPKGDSVGQSNIFSMHIVDMTQLKIYDDIILFVYLG